MAQPTPGEWTLLDGERSIIIGGGPNNDDIAEFFFKDTSTVSIAYDEAVANARLFLHAREVAEALSAIVQHINRPSKERDQAWHRDGYAILDRAREALAKAGV